MIAEILNRLKERNAWVISWSGGSIALWDARLFPSPWKC